MLKIGIIGLGDISTVHLNVIEANPHVELTAACDIDTTLQVKVPNAHFYTDLYQMLEQENLDCVHICLPHYLHLPVTTACVEKGIHVLQEKPLSLNAKEGLELIQLEQKNPDTKICVCFQNRYNETFQTLQRIVQSKTYGEIIGIKGLVTWFRPESYYTDKPWRGSMKTAGGGVLINQAIHTLDLMQLLCGKVKSIKGSTSQLLDYNIEVEDTASAHIKFENNANGMFFATNANVGNSSIELQVIFENEKCTIKDNILTRVNEAGYKTQIIEDKKASGTKSYYGPSHDTLINQFYDCIFENTQNYINVKDALPSIAIIDAIQKSSQTNETIQFESV
ncbi:MULTISPECIES: Gfo/Idh/MocA family protein [Staphylococcus]|jgi:UDP-N-acetyl-2-amino-2-deoxyglucuronate dehydrogenase|uniref:Gfo/Idh/MocA family oxidoreductase n=1 Tax=Staphylococcus nepalensis TaxID=214473 RepID=A0A291JL36_9STAP|nr:MULTISPECIES: Gfo/Idh/MocA family oxidoreductase [Staphylococcus]VDG67118.1 oxidoreductase domain-containing protein [Lacrimispora indolis]ATH60107.1 lipopolysaccharide biosynthesis protein [Staphylococcus nepalensis]ATH65197.1 lipopolysaccharide biosynthesis protein [Staphylococcus nepalensis]AWI44565.1 lipopolysaccharide biosynthesis protein [Staphylococcus nepalensis]MBO1204929.1 Gfo/Idh/MocA family oxidoreductase [Staphylococcus nepalensis]